MMEPAQATGSGKIMAGVALGVYFLLPMALFVAMVPVCRKKAYSVDLSTPPSAWGKQLKSGSGSSHLQVLHGYSSSKTSAWKAADAGKAAATGKATHAPSRVRGGTSRMVGGAVLDISSVYGAWAHHNLRNMTGGIFSDFTHR